MGLSMYGAIVGDIIGSTYESSEVKPTNPEIFCEGSIYTDDTVLTIATADALLRGQAFEDSYRKLYKLYSVSYQNKGIVTGTGFGPSFTEWAEDDKRHHQPYGSRGNGSAMRVSPISWKYDTVDEVLMMAQRSADCTHNHIEGVRGAQAVAIGILLARFGIEPNDIKAHITNGFGYNLDHNIQDLHENYQFNATCEGSIPQALSCLFASTSFDEVMRNCLYIGGDSDTICAISGSIAEAIWGVPEQYKVNAQSILIEHAPYMHGIATEFEKRYGHKTERGHQIISSEQNSIMNRIKSILSLKALKL